MSGLNQFLIQKEKVYLLKFLLVQLYNILILMEKQNLYQAKLISQYDINEIEKTLGNVILDIPPQISNAIFIKYDLVFGLLIVM